MKLYYSRGACSLAARIIINELDLKCEYESVDMKTKKTETGKDFNQINAKSYVPALLVGNELLTENINIQVYLAEKYPQSGLLPAPGDFSRYRVLEWLCYISTELHKSFGAIFNQSIDQSLKNEIFVPMIQKKLRWVDECIAENKFIMGGRFTLPDAYLMVILLWAQKMLPNGIKDCAHLIRYFKDMKEYPSVAKSLQEEGLL